MKIIFSFFCLFHPDSSEISLLMIDRNLQKPAQETTVFTSTQYMQKNFPIYKADVNALIEAANKAAKRIEKGMACYTSDTISTSHTKLIIQSDCGPLPSISVRLLTELEESHIIYNFWVVEREENKRKAQQKLMNLAGYLHL